MSKTAFTVKCFGIYMLLLGVGLVLVPNVLLPLFTMPETSEVWTRVVGVLAFETGIYYWYAAKSEARPFFLASVYVRAAVPFIFTAFAVLGFASPVLVLFGIADLLSAVWTFLTLQKESSVLPDLSIPKKATVSNE
jgi:hypothetical protein